MHIYQKHILDELRQHSERRYSQMQPKDIESSHFKYHLDQLLKEGLVEQKSRGVYGLTLKGMSAVDRLSSHGVNPKQSPKVITYTLIKNAEHYLLWRKDKQPYLGLLNMVGGKLHTGESSHEAAKREILEKTGLTITEVEQRAVAEIKIRNDDTLISHVIAYIYEAPLSSDDTANLVPIRFADIAEQPDLAPDTLEIITALASNETPLLLDLDIAIDL